MKGVVWAEQLAQAATGLVGLGPAILRELDTVIGDCLVYLAVLWTEGGQLWLGQGHGGDWGERPTVALGLGMADENNQPRLCHGRYAHVRVSSKMLRLKMGGRNRSIDPRDWQILIDGGGVNGVFCKRWWDDSLDVAVFRTTGVKHPLSRNRLPEENQDWAEEAEEDEVERDETKRRVRV